MSILVLNLSSHNKVPYEEWLSSLGEDIVLLNASKRVEEFKNKNYAYIEGFENYEINNFVEARALELHKKFKFRRVIAISELDLIRASYLREAFEIPGQKTDSAQIYRDKVKMKKKAMESNMQVPTFSKITNALDLIDFIDKNGYPVVVKPVDSAGSVGTSVLKNESDLKVLLTSGIKENLEVEQFIKGDMYHVDGVIVNNQIIVNWPSIYVNGCLAFQEGKYLGSHMLHGNNPLTMRLKDFVTNILKSFPTPADTAFHAEVFHTDDDELILCEIASRVGGARVNDVIEYAFDVNLLKVWVQSQCNVENIDKYYNKEVLPNKLYGWIIIPPKNGTFISPPDGDPPIQVVDYQVTAAKGQKFNGATMSVDKVASFIVSDTNEDLLKSKIIKLAEWFEKNSIWA
ncbi:acetyl-CoA carboxylase biotin carboxylase subunit family protein [Bacillus cereus group sp. BfR-BA-01380]|uniref:ATP-grasp domain-containing protein n=1 Tax=Bacillus cereus group sp. BfR-BA-01380 TaxID=2920324 RepID=UPI001F5A4F79|nr:ATP-grasp domain-containing protein [Bacillus cereus group sp. BfR-BA-01380]